MNKRATLLSLIFATIPVLHSGPTVATVPSVDERGTPASLLCPRATTDRIWHFDKIVFAITGQLKAASDADQPRLNALPRTTELDIKVLDNPKTVADLKGKVLTFLGALPSPENRPSIRILEVEYAVVHCPKPV
jgi:hypothetical protein